MSRTARILLALGLVVAVVCYFVLLDFGINAGRIHYGVSVEGVDVGGMTEIEAVRVLAERGEDLQHSPVILATEGFDCRFIPDEIGWDAQPVATAEAARQVGARGGIFRALGDRLRAWFEGVEIEWIDKPRAKKIRALVDECEQHAQALGLQVNRWRLRKRIRRSIVTWPRRTFVVPVLKE